MVIIKCKVRNITKYGIIVDTHDNQKGLIHISNIAPYFISDLNSLFKVREILYAEIISQEPLSLSLISGHTIKEDRMKYRETGGGFHVLEYFLENK